MGSRPPFQKIIYGQNSITGPDLDPEKIEKFYDRFGRQILHFLHFVFAFISLKKKYFAYCIGRPGFKPNFVNVKKVKPGLDHKSLRINPRSYWQDFTVVFVKFYPKICIKN